MGNAEESIESMDLSKKGNACYCFTLHYVDHNIIICSLSSRVTLISQEPNEGHLLQQ